MRITRGYNTFVFIRPEPVLPRPSYLPSEPAYSLIVWPSTITLSLHSIHIYTIYNGAIRGLAKSALTQQVLQPANQTDTCGTKVERSRPHVCNGTLLAAHFTCRFDSSHLTRQPNPLYTIIIVTLFFARRPTRRCSTCQPALALRSTTRPTTTILTSEK